MKAIYLEGLFTSFLLIYIAFLNDRLVASLYDHLFFVSYFWMSPLFFTLLLYHDIAIITTTFFTFCSRIVNIIADIFVLHRVFVYKSWTIYKIQNIQNTKFFADYKIQNTKFIFYIDKIFFLEHFKCPLFKVKSFNFVNKC